MICGGRKNSLEVDVYGSSRCVSARLFLGSLLGDCPSCRLSILPASLLFLHYRSWFLPDASPAGRRDVWWEEGGGLVRVCRGEAERRPRLRGDQRGSCQALARSLGGLRALCAFGGFLFRVCPVVRRSPQPRTRGATSSLELSPASSLRGCQMRFPLPSSK